MKAFHIILKGHTLGERLGSKNINIAKSFGLDSEEFAGIPGNNCKHLYKAEGITRFFPGMKRIGQQGCFLSHYFLWKKCIELNCTIAILEHDGVFLRPLPDDIETKFTDVCRLEAFEHWVDDYESNTNASLSNDVKFHKPISQYSNNTSGPFYVGYYGYLLKPSGAAKLINHAKTVGARPVDAHIGTRVVDIVAVTASIVRLDEVYIGKVHELSTTYNFNNVSNR